MLHNIYYHDIILLTWVKGKGHHKVIALFWYPKILENFKDLKAYNIWENNMIIDNYKLMATQIFKEMSTTIIVVPTIFIINNRWLLCTYWDKISEEMDYQNDKRTNCHYISYNYLLYFKCTTDAKPSSSDQ